MTRFSDSIDRLFEDMVHAAWRAPHPPRQPHPPRVPHPTVSEATLEMQFPIPGATCADVAFATEDGRLIVTVRHRASESVDGAQATLERSSERHFQQSITLPLGTEAAAIESRFDADALRIRIALRRRARE